MRRAMKLDRVRAFEVRNNLKETSSDVIDDNDLMDTVAFDLNKWLRVMVSRTLFYQSIPDIKLLQLQITIAKIAKNHTLGG
jgi:hypothetical protein